MRGRLGGIVGSVALAAACGGETVPEEPPPPSEPPCAVGTITLDDGSCQDAGVDACGAGFVSDGRGGCTAVLPPAPCEPGHMAVPGETACREVAPCGNGRWGDIPVDGATEHVDASYAGGMNDGSVDRPWTTIAEGIAAATTGGLVAVAEGVYSEDLIVNKSVRVWGICPARVALRAATATATVRIAGGGDGVELHTLSVTAGTVGIAASGATGVVLDRVWIHDTGGVGLQVENPVGPASVAISGSLIEGSSKFGVLVVASQLDIDATVVRDTQPGPTLFEGGALWVQDDPDNGMRGSVTVRGSLFERNRDVGVFIGGSDGTLDATLVRDTAPRQADQLSGRGLEVIDDFGTGNRGNVTLRGVVIERSVTEGVFLAASDALIETSVIRDTQPRATDLALGRGVAVEPDPQSTAAASVTLRRSLIELSHEHGLYISHGQVLAESLAVRDTRPRPGDAFFGRGIEVHDSVEGRASLTLRDSVVANNVEGGVFLATDALLERVHVHDTVARVVDGLLGDGVVVIRYASDAPLPLVRVEGSWVAASQRAGLANFDGSVTVAGTRFECNAIDLNGQQWSPGYAFGDEGGNVCGCKTEEHPCQLLTTQLAPPDPLMPSE